MVWAKGEEAEGGEELENEFERKGYREIVTRETNNG